MSEEYGFWLSPNGDYYYGPQANWQDILVPERPSWYHVWDWDASQWMLPLATLKANQTAMITAACQAEIDGGFSYEGNDFQSDPGSRAAITDRMALVAAGAALPAGFKWRSAANVDVSMAAADFEGLAQAMVEHVYVQRMKSWALKDQIDAATTRAAVEMVIW